MPLPFGLYASGSCTQCSAAPCEQGLPSTDHQHETHGGDEADVHHREAVELIVCGGGTSVPVSPACGTLRKPRQGDPEGACGRTRCLVIRPEG